MTKQKKRRPGRPTKAETAARSGKSVDPEALSALAAEYKIFKKANPAKAARVPLSIKTQAKALFDSGATYSAIAEACGVVVGSTRAWIEGPANKSNATQPGRGPGRPRQGASSVVKQGWVKIRVEGREVEVAKTDFWDLLKGGLEAGR